MNTNKLKANLNRAKSIDEYWFILFNFCKENNIETTYAQCFDKAKEVAETGKFKLPESAYPEYDEDEMEEDQEAYGVYQIACALADWGIPQGSVVSTMTMAEALDNFGLDEEDIEIMMDYYTIIAEDELTADELFGNSTIDVSKLTVDDFEINIDSDSISQVWNELVKMGYSEGDIVISDDVMDAMHLAGYEGDDEDGFDGFELQDKLEDKYNVTVLAPEDIDGGDKPGEYFKFVGPVPDDDFEINTSALIDEDDAYDVLSEETWARLLKKGYSEGDTLVTDDVIEAITDAAKACCIYEGEYEIDDVTEYLENKYNVEFISPEDMDE